MLQLKHIQSGIEETLHLRDGFLYKVSAMLIENVHASRVRVSLLPMDGKNEGLSLYEGDNIIFGTLKSVYIRLQTGEKIGTVHLMKRF